MATYLEEQMLKKFPSFDPALFECKELKDIACEICQCVPADPVSHRSCHRAFCSECMARWTCRSRTCPHCREPLEEGSVVPLQHLNRLAHSLHSVLQLRCPISTACGATITLGEWPKHVQECPHMKVVCPNAGCPDNNPHQTTLTRATSRIHDERCRFKVQACDFCGFSVGRSKIVPEHPCAVGKALEEMKTTTTEFIEEVRDLRKEILPFTGNTKFKADQVVDLLNSVSEQVRSKLNNIKAEALKIQSDTTKWWAQLKPGDQVDAIDEEGRWLEGIVTQSDTTKRKVRVHYKGWGDVWDRQLNMDARKIAKPHTHTKRWREELSPGDQVEYRVIQPEGPRWYPALVSAVCDEEEDRRTAKRRRVTLVTDVSDSVLTVDAHGEDICALHTHIKPEHIQHRRRVRVDPRACAASS